MPENKDFCLSLELFSWVSDFLSFGVLEFFSGVHKKKPVKYGRLSWIYLDEKSPSPDIHFTWVRGPDSSLFVMVTLVLTSELLSM